MLCLVSADAFMIFVFCFVCVRCSALGMTLLALDAFFVYRAYHSVITQGASVQLVFGFEVRSLSFPLSLSLSLSLSLFLSFSLSLSLSLSCCIIEHDIKKR